MGRTEQLAEILERLGPRGAAWPRGSATKLRKLLEGIGETFARTEDRARMLREEADSRTTNELLGDFELELGLPGNCPALSTSTVARRAAVIARWTSVIGQTPAELLAIAQRFAFAVSIEEHHPSEAQTAEAHEELCDDNAAHAFTLHASDQPVVFFRVGYSAVGQSPLAHNSKDLLECAVKDATPAHAAALFLYDLDPDTSYQPWEPIDFRPTPASALPKVPLPTLQG